MFHVMFQVIFDLRPLARLVSEQLSSMSGLVWSRQLTIDLGTAATCSAPPPSEPTAGTGAFRAGCSDGNVVDL
jgi:hypothetical protein